MIEFLALLGLGKIDNLLPQVLVFSGVLVRSLAWGKQRAHPLRNFTLFLRFRRLTQRSSSVAWPELLKVFNSFSLSIILNLRLHQSFLQFNCCVWALIASVVIAFKSKRVFFVNTLLLWRSDWWFGSYALLCLLPSCRDCTLSSFSSNLLNLLLIFFE